MATVNLTAAAAERRPNILYIMSDDHAAHAISCYGSRVNKTPNIDALARSGVRMDRVCATNPICSPSRASILTGQYSHRNGMPSFNAIDPSHETVAGVMRDAGYYTAFVGKWHLGGPESVRDGDWDRWMIYENQGVYRDPYFWERDGNGGFRKTVFKGAYATENLTEVAKRELDAALASGKPFFMMMHHKAPHRNWLPSERYRDSFRRLTLKDIPLPDTLFDTHEGRASAMRDQKMTLLRHMRIGSDLKPAEYFSNGGVFEFEGRRYGGAKNENGRYVDDWPVGCNDRAKTAFAYLRYMQDYLACVQSVDDSVGEMVAYLKKKGVFDDTIVVYASDQGFFLGDHGLYDKRFIMEETLKMPLVVSYPRAIPAGSTSRALVSNVDFAPTLLEAAGIPAPAFMQGRALWDAFTGKDPTGNDAVYCRYYVEGGQHGTAAWYGVVTPQDKLVFYYRRGEWEYFDTMEDPEELRNRIDDPACASRIAELRKKIAGLRAKYGDDDSYADVEEYVEHPRAR